MRRWRMLPVEAGDLFCPIGLLPVDDLTGGRPIGALQVFLDAAEGSAWRPTGIGHLTTLGGVITYPALGRVRAPRTQGPRRYRVRVEAQYYLPNYRRDQDGIEFDAYPYDDRNPPSSVPAAAAPLFLMPAPGYPFPGHLMIWRGVVVDAAGAPVPHAEVSIAATRRALADARGCFALPAPRPLAPGPVLIDAADLRSGRVGGVAALFPQGLVRNVQIVIS